MNVRSLPFFSNGLRLDADLHLPCDIEPGAAPPFPAIIPASGFQGLKVIHPERFARALCRLGFAVLTFDYAGFGASEGERGRLVPQEWVEQVRCAVDCLETVSEVDSSRIGLLGWGLGGGVVICEAADDPRVRAVACVNGIGDGTRATRTMHDERSWHLLLDRIAADRGRRARRGRSEIISPWEIVRLDTDRDTDSYVRLELYRAPGFGSGVTVESAEALLRFRPEAVVHRIAPRPLLIVHGGANRLHPPEEARSLYRHAADPKKLVILPDRGHTEWMFDEHPMFEWLVKNLDQFFTLTFGSGNEHVPHVSGCSA